MGNTNGRINCPGRHASFQPKPELIRCPVCGADDDDFQKVDVAPSAIPQCRQLHNMDVLHCKVCGHQVYGGEFSRILVKKMHLVTCPRCGGDGHIHKAKINGFYESKVNRK